MAITPQQKMQNAVREHVPNKLSRDAPLRFVILRHEGRPGKQDHFDVLFESKPGKDPEEQVMLKFETALSLQRTVLPISFGGVIRRRYLTYEGPMRNNNGTVRRVAEGTFKVLNGDNVIECSGTELNGIYRFDTVEASKKWSCFEDTEALVHLMRS
jgi:hypothetical protein